MANTLFFHIFTPYKIEAVNSSLNDFVADDLVEAIAMRDSRIATSEVLADELRKAYPSYYEYKIVTEEIVQCLKTVHSS